MKKYLVFFAAALFAVSCSSTDELDELTKGQNNEEGVADGQEVLDAYTRYTIDFENLPFDPDGPTPYAVDEYGSNFYSAYDNPFISYTHQQTGLTFGINQATSPWTGITSYEYYYGGIGLSTFNNSDDVTFMNQMSVYAGFDGIEGPGNGGSASFAVAFGYNDEANGVIAPYLEFKNQSTANFISMYVCNTVYARDVILNGNGYGQEGEANSLEKQKGYFYINITGHKLNGDTITSKYYLADYSGATDLNGIREGWSKVDLTGFNEVYKLEFSLDGSDVGDYGLNTPAYFAFDDLVFDKASTEK